VLVADPPWKFKDNLPGKGRGANKHYLTLDIEGIQAFVEPEDLYRPTKGELTIAGDATAPVVDRNAILFLWRVSSMVPAAYNVVASWGFTPKAELVWIKKTRKGNRHFGMGHYTRAEHESCIIATRGKVELKTKSVRSTFEASIGRHSEKPDEFYEIVEEMCEGPYLELFARKHREGWTCLGNELHKDESKGK